MSINEEELHILNDTHFLKLKLRLSEKVISYFSSIERSLNKRVSEMSDFPFPEGTFLKGGKISKGEQYKQLPYFILDFPRLFTQKEIFAYRTMLWWGHHLSCTLQLSGPILEQHKDVILGNIFKDKELYFCVNDQPWDYDFDEENYRKIKHLSEFELRNQITQNGFIKVSDYLHLDEWDAFESFTLKNFERFSKFFY